MREENQRLSPAEVSAMMSMARDYAVATSDGSSHVQTEIIARLLKRIRQAFRMDVVFVSEFERGFRRFKHVDASEDAVGILKEGEGDPLEQSYCQRVVDGRLPQVIQNAGDLPEARSLPATKALPVGAHLSVPIRLPCGTVYGTLCCFSREENPALAESDAQALQAIADLIAAGVDPRGRLRSKLLLRDVPGASM